MTSRWLLSWLVWFFYRLWTSTWRVRVIESEGMKLALEKGEPIIFAHWHGSELCIVHLVRRYKIATMTSTSKDGQLIDFTIRRLGGATSKGSSTRGGIGALKGLIRLVRSGYRASMAVDGPKGPIYKVKAGVFELSKLTSGRIIPVGAASSNAITFEKSWNKAKLPKPFSRVVIYFADAWEPVGRERSAHDPDLAQRLEGEISNACQSAEELLR